MLRLFVVVVSMFSSVLFTNELVANQKEKFVPNKISPLRYVAGGILGTTLGFGSGHSVQGRWWEDYGWVFTAASIITGLGERFWGQLRRGLRSFSPATFVGEPRLRRLYSCKETAPEEVDNRVFCHQSNRDGECLVATQCILRSCKY